MATPEQQEVEDIVRSLVNELAPDVQLSMDWRPGLVHEREEVRLSRGGHSYTIFVSLEDAKRAKGVGSTLRRKIRGAIEQLPT